MFPEKGCVVWNVALNPDEGAPLRMCLAELLERWDELPQCFTESARTRCLKRPVAKLAAGVQAARRRMQEGPTRSGRAVCPVARFMESLRLTDEKKGLRLDWELLTNLSAYQAKGHLVSQVCGQGSGATRWLETSPVYRLRTHLKGSGKLRSGDISDLCANYQRALFEREACQGSDILERYTELRESFGLNRMDLRNYPRAEVSRRLWSRKPKPPKLPTSTSRASMAGRAIEPVTDSRRGVVAFRWLGLLRHPRRWPGAWGKMPKSNDSRQRHTAWSTTTRVTSAHVVSSRFGRFSWRTGLVVGSTAEDTLAGATAKSGRFLPRPLMHGVETRPATTRQATTFSGRKVCRTKFHLRPPPHEDASVIAAPHCDQGHKLP